MYIYVVYAKGNGYDTVDTPLGYAEDEETAERMVEQAEVLNRLLKYAYKEVRVGFILEMPYINRVKNEQ